MKRFLEKLFKLNWMRKKAAMGDFEMVPVESSNIDSIGYDKTEELLYVRFKNGSLYNYERVPEETFNELMAADSKGSFLARYIKGIYAYNRVE